MGGEFSGPEPEEQVLRGHEEAMKLVEISRSRPAAAEAFFAQDDFRRAARDRLMESGAYIGSEIPTQNISVRAAADFLSAINTPPESLTSAQTERLVEYLAALKPAAEEGEARRAAGHTRMTGPDIIALEQAIEAMTIAGDIGTATTLPFEAESDEDRRQLSDIAHRAIEQTADIRNRAIHQKPGKL